MTTSTNKLSATDQVKPVANSSTVIQVYCNMIQEAPLINGGTLLPNLEQHQKTAQGHAANWLKIYSPQMSSVLADILDYGNTFTSTYSLIKGLLPKISNDKSAQQQVQEGLQYLRDQVNAKETACQAVAGNLTKFHDNLANDVKNFEADNAEAKVKISGDKGAIAATKTAIDGDNNAIHEANKQITNGIIEISCGGAAVIGGIGLAVITAGSSSFISGALVVGGAAAITVGAITIHNAEKARDKAMADLAAQSSKLAGLHQEINSLTQISGALTNFADSAKAAVDATSGLAKQWGNLKADLDEVIGELQKAIDGNNVFSKAIPLETANKDWTAAVNLATYMQAHTQLPVKVAKDSADLIKQMEKEPVAA